MKIDAKETELSKFLLVLGYIAVKDLAGTPEKIRVLESLGYGNKEMAIICNTSDGNIRNQKVLNKRKKK